MFKKEEIISWGISVIVVIASALIPWYIIQDSLSLLGKYIFIAFGQGYFVEAGSEWVINLICSFIAAVFITFPLKIKGSLMIGTGLLIIGIPILVLLVGSLSSFDNYDFELNTVFALPIYTLLLLAIFIVRRYLPQHFLFQGIFIGALPGLAFATLMNFSFEIIYFTQLNFPVGYPLVVLGPGALFIIGGIFSSIRKNRIAKKQ